MNGPRVLVCGGRNYADPLRVEAILDAFRRVYGISLVIDGGQDGADNFGHRWAVYRGVPTVQEDAEWVRYGRPAGPIRNQKMIDLHRPDVVIAFNGHDGSADMRRRAKAAGLPVLEGGDARQPSDVIKEFHPDSRHMTV